VGDVLIGESVEPIRVLAYCRVLMANCYQKYGRQVPSWRPERSLIYNFRLLDETLAFCGRNKNFQTIFAPLAERGPSAPAGWQAGTSVRNSKGGL
jgi:hypothetical protein